MCAHLSRELKESNYTIDDYLNHNCGREEEFYNSPIINIVQTDGIMGTPEQLKLKELYPELQEAVLKFLSKKNHGKLMIHKEEGKPIIINMFEYIKAGDTSNYFLHKSAMKAFNLLRKNGKIDSLNFVYFGKTQNKRITDRLYSSLSWRDSLYELAV